LRRRILDTEAKKLIVGWALAFGGGILMTLFAALGLPLWGLIAALVMAIGLAVVVEAFFCHRLPVIKELKDEIKFWRNIWHRLSSQR